MKATKDFLHTEEGMNHRRFIKERLASIDFRAEEKLRRIDELADIVFAARANYRKQTDEDPRRVRKIGSVS